MARSGSLPPLEAVTFDFWNTLIRAEPGVADVRRAAWLRLLGDEGIAVDEDRLRAAQGHVLDRFDEHWTANRIYGAADAVADLVAHLDVDASPALREGLLTSFVEPDRAHDPEPTEGVQEALEALQLAGVRLGIICDVGLTPSSTLRRYLSQHDLLGYFDHWSFSDEVGCCKPDPAIFAHALSGLGGVAPDRAAHIGDLRRTDVAGALGSGLFAVRYAGRWDDPEAAEAGTVGVEADVVIDDYADLPAALGLA